MASPPTVPSHITENIENIADLQQTFGSGVSRQQRAIEALTGRLGRPRTLYMLLGTVAFWTTYNLAATALRWPTLDHPPFFWLQGALTFYAAVVATTVLTAQTRQNRENERRAHLELQVGLLAEQKATKIISLLEELRRDMPNVRNRRDSVAEAMQQRSDPKDVLSALESTMENRPVDARALEAARAVPRDPDSK